MSVTATPAREAAPPAVRRRLVVEPRALPSPAVRVGAVAGSVLAALLVGALVLLVLGEDPWATYRSMYDSSLGSSLVFSQTLVRAAPLVLTAAAAAVAYRMRVYTIGQDGQLIAGAIVSSGVALAIGPHLAGLPTVAVVLAIGVLGGALWALIPALARAYLSTNVVLSTLMMNFIALGLMNYLVVGSMSPWRDKANAAAAQAAPIPAQAGLPHLFQQADVGIVIAVAVALLLAAAVRLTRWGFELRVVGDSVEAARYAGIDVAKHVVGVVCLSGALCGLAGAIQVTSVTQALDPAGVDPGLGLGYTGIVVAALARLGLIASVPVAVLMAALLNAGPALQLIGVPSALVVVLQGTILLFVAASQFLLSYRVRRAGEMSS
ncbi:MAG TPA: ABC transporter permease [Conexibacter sp.]|nr:ABC transporter permease [Conexibacter sp.]